MLLKKNNHLTGWGSVAPLNSPQPISFMIFNSILILGIFFCFFQHLRQVISFTVSTNRVNYSGESRGGHLFLGQTGARKAPKKLFWGCPESLYQGLDDPPPPLPLPIWRTGSTTELYKVVVIFFPTTWPKDVVSILLAKKSPTNCISIIIIFRRKKCLLSSHKLLVK